jgi:hypothetical protein
VHRIPVSSSADVDLLMEDSDPLVRGLAITRQTTVSSRASCGVSSPTADPDAFSSM